MATIIDSLIMTLGLDASDLSAGVEQAEQNINKLDETAQKTGQGLTKSFQAGAEGARTLGQAAIEAFTALADIARINLAIGNLPQILNIAPEQLKKWDLVVNSTGGKAGEVAAGFSHMQAMHATPEGRAALSGMLARLTENGIHDVYDEKGRLRQDGFDRLITSEKSQSLLPEIRKNLLSSLGFGEGVQNFANHADAPQQLKAYRNSAPANEGTEHSNQLLKDWTKLQADVEQKIVNALAPGIQSLAKALDAFNMAEKSGHKAHERGRDSGLFALWLREREKGRTPETISETISGNASIPASQSGINPAQQEEIKRTATQFYLGKGYTPEQTAGLVARMQRESAFDPMARGDNGKAVGLFQWHPDRRKHFEERFGHSFGTGNMMQQVREQLEFSQMELTIPGLEKAAGDRIRASKTAFGAGGIVSRDYIRPAVTGKEADFTGRLAENIAAQLRAGSPAPALAPAPAPINENKVSNTQSQVVSPYSPRTAQLLATLGQTPQPINPGVTMRVPQQAVQARSALMAPQPAPTQIAQNRSIKIGDIHVHSQASDPRAVANAVRQALYEQMGDDLQPTSIM